MFEILAYIAHTFSLTNLKLVATIILSYFSYAIGGFDMAIKALLILMMLDFVFGFAHAWKEARIQKHKLILGMVKIMAYCVTLIIGNMVDLVIFHVHMEWGFLNFIVVYLGVTEALSIIKHLEVFGVKLPQKLIAKLESYKEQEIH